MGRGNDPVQIAPVSADAGKIENHMARQRGFCNPRCIIHCKTDQGPEVQGIMNRANDNAAYLISTQGLSKTYGGIQARTSLDLKIPRFSIYGFLGPNGAGKSTTIKLLLGLVKPTCGSGTVFGLDIVNDSTLIRKRTGYLPQNPRYYDYMTARQILEFTAGFFYDRKSGMIQKRVEEVLELSGLRDRADRAVKGFSGGELQRLGIAQAQVNEPDLLILDEPAASLDPMGRKDVLDVMRSLKGKTTIFYSTHILDDVERVSDMVGIMNGGELVAQAPVVELLNAKHGAVYDLVVEGAQESLRDRIGALPWVSLLHADNSGCHAHWSLSVTDEAHAEKNLLRILLEDENVVVREFTRRKDELEDVFMRIVQGDADVIQTVC